MRRKLEAEKSKSMLLSRKVKLLEDKLEHTRHRFGTIGNSPSVHIEGYTNYLSYKYNTLKNTNVWNTAEKIYSYSRRSLFIARIFKYTSLFIAFIETSAVFLVFGAAILILIPATLALTLILSMLDSRSGKRLNKEIIPKLYGKRIIFLIAKDGFSPSRHSYFDNMALDLSRNEARFVIIVSHSLRNCMPRGSRCIGENLAVIRETNFFRLMKSIEASDIDKNSILIVH